MARVDTALEIFKKEYGITLDEKQSIACSDIEGKILLLAVPGSGKTTVMVARIGYMTGVKDIPGRSILAITYSVAGAREMQSRYKRIFGRSDVEFRTINGFCAVMLNRYEKITGRRVFTLIEKESDSSSILRQIMINEGSYPTENELRDVKTAITYCKNNMMTLDEIEKEIHIDGRDFPAIYKEYEAFKLKNRLMDYDDQLVYGYKVLKSHPEVNAVYADTFKYICVDEAQDTSKLQHAIIHELVKKCGNLFMVGDEDQSIYGFRAAYPKALLDFSETYPDAKILTIDNNYRSTPEIISRAGAFIKLNKERLGENKNMHTDNPSGTEPKRIKLSDINLLPSYIRRISDEKKEGSTAVLFRLNDSMIPIIDLLAEKEIPFRVRGGDGLFFTSTVVTDAINILSFAENPYDGELFRRLYYKLSLGLSKSELEKTIKNNSGDDMLPYADYLSGATWLHEKKRARAKKLHENLMKIVRSDAYEALMTVFFDIGYGRSGSVRSAESAKRNALLAIASRHRDRTDFHRRLKELEGEVRRGSVSENGIVLSTIHSSKGLEFDRVILCDCKVGVLPSLPNVRGLCPKDMAEREEDRRLFYVGVTRAKSELEIVTWDREFGAPVGDWEFPDAFFGTEKRKNGAKSASKTALNNTFGTKTRGKTALFGSVFPTEDDISLLKEQYPAGTEIIHKTFGEGEIISHEGSFAEIKFRRFPTPKKLELMTCVDNRLIKKLRG